MTAVIIYTDFGAPKLKFATVPPSITDYIGRSLSKLWEMMKDREACRAAVCEVAKSET